MQRYHRQIIFSGLGEQGQAKLGQAKVVQVGCGGLGSVLAQCMVRAGVGKLTIIDHDTPDITNLHRQFLFDEDDVGKKLGKAGIAEKKLKKADSGVEITGIPKKFSGSNAHELLAGHDLVLDGADNMLARYAINDWCVKNNIPWIYGGIIGATGMTMVIVPGKTPCLCCLYSETEKTIKTSSAGPRPVINTIPAFIASLQATEAIKLLTGSPDLITDLRIVDLWSGEFQQITVEKDLECVCCGKKQFTFLE